MYVSVSQALKENTYPFLGLIVLRENRMTAVARIEGPISKCFYITIFTPSKFISLKPTGPMRGLALPAELLDRFAPSGFALTFLVV